MIDPFSRATAGRPLSRARVMPPAKRDCAKFIDRYLAARHPSGQHHAAISIYVAPLTRDGHRQANRRSAPSPAAGPST